MNKSLFGLVAIVIVGYFIFNFFNSSGYAAYKCDYQAAVFGANASSNLKEFGGDPCMKKGKNRFKNYYSKKFSSQQECENYINTAPQSVLQAPRNRFVLGCDNI
tara:strand:- start:197 stop:508 length:312 start_codon:yes stop_codon:yes gene_type:complete